MFNFAPTVVLLGATGAVGRPLTAELTARGIRVVPVSRRGPDGVDLGRYPEQLDRLTADADLTVNASGLELPELARHSRAPFVDISASAPYLADLAAVPGAGVVLGVGLAPGLTTMLIREVSAGTDDLVDVGIVLGVGEHHGPAAREWTARMLGRTFHSPADNTGIRNFSRPITLPMPRFGRRRLYRADFPDGAFPQLSGTQLSGTQVRGNQVGGSQLGGPQVRNHLGLSSRAATLALAIGTRIPRLAGPLLSTPLPGTHDWSLVAVSAAGRLAGATGTGQSRATAALTALTVAAALREGVRGAVVHQADLLDLAAVEALDGISVQRGHRLSGG